MADINVGIWGWDYAVAPLLPDWHKVHVAAATGNLQVDVITAALPAGAATLAAQDISNDWLSRINVKLAGGLPAALVGGALSVTSLATSEQHIYGWDGANWQTLLVESAVQHNLRVRLYGGANAVLVGQSSAALAYTNYGIETFAILYGDDGTNLSRVGMLLAGADGVDNALNTLGVASMLYGFNGVSWDRLEVESAILHTLRVSIWEDGTIANITNLIPGAIADATQCLSVACFPYLSRPGSNNWREVVVAESIHDGDAGATMQAVSLMGYNGASWDRLRTYGVGVLKVGRAEIDSTTIRKTVAGAVVAGAHNLYWIACSPDGPGSEFELTDAIAGGGAVVFDHFDPDKHSEVIHLDPPMKFATGIWIEKFDHIHSLTFCYV